MTVYELIQRLSKHPANCEVLVTMYADNEHMEHYLVDMADVCAKPLRTKQNWNSVVVTLECQPEDL